MPARPRVGVLLILLTVTLAACGGGTAAETTTTTTSGGGDTTTTTAAPTTTAAAAPTTTTTAATTTTSAAIGIDDIPPECLAPLLEVLHLYEPVVSGVDWEHATIDDHIQVVFDLAGASISGQPDNCDVELAVSDEEGNALMLTIAEQEAPGTVGYLIAMREIDLALEGRAASGDCLTDIALMEVVVAAGVPWIDLPLPEQWYVMSLMYSIGYCGLRTQGDFVYRDDVQEFLAGSPFADGSP